MAIEVKEKVAKKMTLTLMINFNKYFRIRTFEIFDNLISTFNWYRKLVTKSGISD